MSKRKEATEYALKMISLIDPSGINTDIRRKELEELSDEQFDQLMQTYASGKDRLPLIAPNFGKVNLDVERNIDLAKEHFNHSFFQQIVHHSQDPDTPSYVGEPKYLVMEMPYRRTMQLLVEGISVASHNNSIDQRTGAVTGASAAAKFSGPEGAVVQSMGMMNTFRELMSVRGGDQGAFRAMEVSIQRTGEASLEEVAEFGTGRESVATLSNYLTAMHIANS